MNIDIIAGARPNFVKIAPIIHAIQEVNNGDTVLNYRLVHTGQHYDKNMSDDFFVQLNIPKPDVYLHTGSGTHAEQTAKIMLGYEALLQKTTTDLCLVVGDVNSTLACSIVAKKMQIPLAHVEAGLRSYDLKMPEEINRMVTDSITDFFFTTTADASQNLRNAGVKKDNIFLVGNTMVDTLLQNRLRFTKPLLWEKLSLDKGAYFVMTLHRPENVDEIEYLELLMGAIIQNVRNYPIIFPMHPRTAKTFNKSDIKANHLHICESLSYLQFNYLIEHAKAVITDSGGISEETTVMGIPCLTLRNNTERPETVSIGTNELISTGHKGIVQALDKLFAGNWKKGSVPDLWDGHTGRRIVDHLLNLKG